MRKSASRTILFFHNPSCLARRDVMAGILQTARSRDVEVVLFPSVTSAEEIRALIARHRPLGCISNRNFADNSEKCDAFRNTPTVFFGNNPLPGSRHALLVRDDAPAIADMAVRELLALAPASYAYVADESQADWSRRRGAAFVRAVSPCGKPCSILNPRNLLQELESVPKPCGILAANDMTASSVYAVAQRLGLGIPKDLAIIGVDNDELLCTSLTPSLSSVQMNLTACGRLAIDWLVNPTDDRIREYGPLAAIRRASTAFARPIGPVLGKALALISLHACEGDFSVDDLAFQVGCSRRYIDRTFREQLHQTALEAIHDVRLARIMTLLGRSDMPIGSIANASGFRTQIALQKFFLRRMGLSMQSWRRKHGVVP